MNKNIIERQEIVPEKYSGERFDKIVALLIPEFSRSRLKQWILSGELKVNQQIVKPKIKVFGGDMIELSGVVADEVHHQAESIRLNVVYEDESILVINKPAGLVVHPAAGHHHGTLLNGLLNHCDELNAIPRAGIVHRLDKDTTGLMVVAKTLSAHKQLVDQLQERTVSRIYEAVACGVMTAGGCVNEPIGRHRIDRKKMTVTENGKHAVTHYRLLEKFSHHTHVRVQLETGRTHQIRVHMAHIRYPLVGDQVYRGRLKIPAGCSDELAEKLRRFKRQALHAKELGLTHPESGELMQWQSTLPDDFMNLLECLKNDENNAPL